MSSGWRQEGHVPVDRGPVAGHEQDRSCPRLVPTSKECERLDKPFFGRFVEPARCEGGGEASQAPSEALFAPARILVREVAIDGERLVMGSYRLLHTAEACEGYAEVGQGA